MSRFGIAWRVAALALAFAILGPPHWIALRLLGRRASLAPVLFHRVFLRLFSVRVTQSGTPPALGEAALVLANHVSWLDIIAIGSLRPLSFVAKSEIAGWPVISTLAGLQRTLYID
ncbi:MAG: 1-acyl-sn-glycerol-3-phosphate acyltransferase, partial [Actinomycetospora chiangmaiensis]|nr:1-acyl-sn-glycerol-3-phosphate acyltransferase [Actinomycetospora chiangmaiensis]